MRRISDALIYGLARIALLAGALLPALIYVLIGYSGLSQLTEEDARIQAHRIGYAIVANPGVWHLTTERLLDQIEEIRHAQTHTLLTDLSGKTLTQTGEDCTGYCVSGNAPLMDFGKVAGNLRVDVDAAPLFVKGALFGTAGLVIGLMLLLLLNRTLSERRRTEEALRLTRFSVDAASDAIYWIAPDARIVDVNTAACRSLGYTRKELLKLVVPDVDSHVNAEAWRLHYAELRQRGTITLESEHRTRDGRSFPVEIVANHVVLGNKELNCAFVRDITERKRAEAELRIAAAAFESQEGIVITDVNDVILRINKAFSLITGYTAEEAIGQKMNILKSDRHDTDFYAAMWQRLLNEGVWQGEILNRIKSGEVRPHWLSITAVRDSLNVVTHYVGTYTDITERKLMEEQVRQLAFYDTLTNLPNRRLIADRLDQIMASTKRSSCYGAVMFLDLDNFKPLNDTHGHEVGDLLLIEVAHRLRACVRAVDSVGRFGGDEFVVMLSELNSSQDASKTQARIVAEKIRASLAEPYQLVVRHEGEAETTIEHRCTVSIGVALFIDHEASQEDIIKWADMAMYEAKDAGRNLVRFSEVRDGPATAH
ncbi:MAG: diguanylate cyclase [Sterolibacterium sp.]